MKSPSTSSSRLLLPLLVVLLLAVIVTDPARAAATESRRPASTTSGPVFGEWLEGVSIGRPSDRRTVVRIAALGMALAMFIMFRNKH
jgi:hypothetical protein